MYRILIPLVWLATCAVTPETWADNITVKRGAETVQLVGEIIVEAQDGGILFRASDGRLWRILPEEIVSKTDDDEPVQPATAKEVADALLQELPTGFRIYETQHFLVAYQSNKTSARWVGGLYEKLYKGFDKFWIKDSKLDLDKPRYPLIAIIFDTKAEYSRYVIRELGTDPGMVAYYNLETNRVAMFDLTGSFRPAGVARDNRKVHHILNTPAAIPMVATIIHEGTHQLIFNRGMQTRFADTPFWLTEGLAMFFETPDLRQSAGWKGVGKINPLRYPRLVQGFSSRKGDSLTELICSEDKFNNPETSLDAYSESWALVYFLLKKYPREFVQYIELLSSRKELVEVSAEQRLADFQRFFGEDLGMLDREFVEYMRRAR